MRLTMPITKRKVQNHFHYSLWKYLLLVMIALFGWNLIYTTTRYRPPENLKVEFFAEGNTMATDALQTLSDRIRSEVMPEMEEVTATVVTFDDTYGDMQLTVWVSAGQGDVYLISRERFLNMAGNEATLNLQPSVDSGVLAVDGIDLSQGMVRNETTGRLELMGIPADNLTGLADYGLTGEKKVLCVLVNGGNDEYALKYLNYLLTHLRSPADAGAADVAPAASVAP